MRIDEMRVAAENSRYLKQSFSTLVDSITDAERMKEIEDRIQGIENATKSRLAALEKLQGELGHVVLSYEDSLGKDWTDSLEKQITNLSTVAIDLTRKKVQDKYGVQLKEDQLTYETERTRTFKSIEAFLATQPFNVVERTISVNLVNNIYMTVAKYNCAEDIQFEFSLDSNKNPNLSKKLRAPGSEEKLRIPVSTGKKLLKKEPSADYEDLDDYVLSNAQVTDTSMTATFDNSGKSNSIRILDSKRDSLATLTIEYSSPGTKMVVTSEPALASFLNTQLLESASDALWRSILECEKSKIGLVKVVSDGQVVYADNKLDPLQFLSKSWRILEPRVEAVVRSNPDSPERSSSTGGETDMDETFVRQKIGSMGRSGEELLESLKLN
jgi:hypothetical protein